MTDDTFADLKPAQVAQTLRSLPRRVREALAQRLDRAPESFVHIVGGDGVSILDLLADGAAALTVIDRALEQTLLSDSPVVPAAVTDPSQRNFERPPLSLADTLALFDDATATMADRIDQASASDWLRPATLTGGTATTAHAIAQESARTGVTMLRTIEPLVLAVTAS